MIMNLNSSLLLAQLVNVFQYSSSSAAADRAILNMYFTNIAQPGRTILDVSFLEIDNVSIMTSVRIYCNCIVTIYFRQYFIVYLDSSHNTVILDYLY